MQNDLAIKGAAYAKEAIALTSTNRNASARKAMAAAAVRIGNYDEDGKAQWAAYLAAGCPMNMGV